MSLTQKNVSEMLNVKMYRKKEGNYSWKRKNFRRKGKAKTPGKRQNSNACTNLVPILFE